MDSRHVTITGDSGLVTCPLCQGTGQRGRGLCPRCSGIGQGARVGGVDVYWGYALDAGRLAEERLREFSHSLLRGVTFLVAFLGLIALVYDSVVDISQGLIPFAIIFKRGTVPLIFWLGVLADLFIFVTLERDLERSNKIPRRVYHSSALLPGKKVPWLDIWDTMNTAARRVVIEAERVVGQRPAPCRGSDLFAATLSHDGVRVILGRLGVSLPRLQSTLQRALANPEMK